VAGDRLYWSSIATYVVSLGLPAVIGTHSDPNMWGWEAFTFSLTPIAIVAWPSNVGYVAAALLYRLHHYRTAAVVSVIAVADMAVVGCIFLSESRGSPIRLPFGFLGPGYFAWTTAGVTMGVSASRRIRERRRHPQPIRQLPD
jgi:hypothetical protein